MLERMMSQSTINIAKVELQRAKDGLPRLRKLVVDFEARLAAATKGLPPFVTPENPRFAKPLGDVAQCRQLVIDIKEAIKKHTTKISKQEQLLKAAEKALAETEEFS
jgi:hypothetical protein